VIVLKIDKSKITPRIRVAFGFGAGIFFTQAFWSMAEDSGIVRPVLVVVFIALTLISLWFGTLDSDSDGGDME
jgi:hypothetical protein